MILAASVNDFVGLTLREDFFDEAMQSWAEYLETGLHLTGQEVRDWLENWGTKAEADLPAPHG